MLSVNSKEDIYRNLIKGNSRPSEFLKGYLNDKAEDLVKMGSDLVDSVRNHRVKMTPHSVERFQERFELPDATEAQILYLIRESKYRFEITAQRRFSTQSKGYKFGIRQSRPLNIFLVVIPINDPGYDFLVKTTLWDSQDMKYLYDIKEFFRVDIDRFFNQEKIYPEFEIIKDRVCFYLKDTENNKHGLESKPFSLCCDELKRDIEKRGLLWIYNSAIQVLYNRFFRDSGLEVHPDHLVKNPYYWYANSGIKEALENAPKIVPKEIEPAPAVSCGDTDVDLMYRKEWTTIEVGDETYPLRRMLNKFKIFGRNRFKVLDREEDNDVIEEILETPYHRHKLTYNIHDKQMVIEVSDKTGDTIREFVLTGYTSVETLKALSEALSYGELSYADSAMSNSTDVRELQCG